MGEKSLFKPPVEELSATREGRGEAFVRLAESIQQNIRKFRLSGEYSSKCNLQNTSAICFLAAIGICAQHLAVYAVGNTRHKVGI